MRRLETFDWWSSLVEDKDDLSLRELAEKYGVTPGAISAALKRQGITRKPAPPGPRAYRQDHDSDDEGSEATGSAADETLPPEPGEAVPADVPEGLPEPRPGSKDHLLMQHADLLGEVPDSEVAEKAGVSQRTVAAYRRRAGIDAYRRGSGSSKKRSGGRKRRPGRRSKVEPFHDEVGKVPDPVIAEKAGLSVAAVRNYRRKHGIELEPQARRKPGRKPKKSRARSTGGVGEVKPVTSGPEAWKVTLQSGSRTTTRVVLAANLADAASQAGDALKGRVVSVEYVGPVL